MNRKLIITNYLNGIVIILFADHTPIEIFFEPKEETSLIGNIYIGRVQNIVKNIHAAFIEIENQMPCYYSLEHESKPYYTNFRPNRKSLAAGDELLVQVSRDAVKTKVPSVTSTLNLTGKYLVLIWSESGIHVSTNISGKSRDHFKELMEKYQSDSYGWIIRTNALDVSDSVICSEAEMLIERLNHILEISHHRSARSCIERKLPSYIEIVKNLHRQEFDEVITDEEIYYKELSQYFQNHQPEDLDKLSFYNDHLLSIDKLYSFEKAFSSALNEKVWLKSGAYLIIQPTEALTVIDVNSGKCTIKKDVQKTFYKINLEAAKEAAHQLRLRNISGIIIIDFINMSNEEDRFRLMEELKKDLKKDPQKTVLIDMTPLGLVEITRKRSHKSLKEMMNQISS